MNVPVILPGPNGSAPYPGFTSDLRYAVFKVRHQGFHPWTLCLRGYLFKLFGSFPFSQNRVVGSSGLEPPTPTLSGWCSNQLSYEPIYH